MTHDPEIRALLQRLLSMSLDTPSTVADVFVEWSPHVSSVTVRVHVGGWEAAKAAGTEDEPQLYEHVYLDETFGSVEEVRTQLSNMVGKVGQLINGGVQ